MKQKTDWQSLACDLAEKFFGVDWLRGIQALEKKHPYRGLIPDENLKALGDLAEIAHHAILVVYGSRSAQALAVRKALTKAGRR